MIQNQLKARQSPLAFFLVRSNAEIAPVEEYELFFSKIPANEQTIAFLDPSANPHNPGWPLRNLLAYFRALYPSTTSTLRILCWRDPEIPSSDWKSRFGVIHIGAGDAQLDTRPSAVGWEKSATGKLGPRVADLGPMMDPKLLANQAVDLNLKLMRWRILPSLNLEKVSSTRCLLLGAGTLGCYIARTLMVRLRLPRCTSCLLFNSRRRGVSVPLLLSIPHACRFQILCGNHCSSLKIASMEENPKQNVPPKDCAKSFPTSCGLFLISHSHPNAINSPARMQQVTRYLYPCQVIPLRLQTKLSLRRLKLTWKS